MKYMARRGIKDWMVWDRETRRPAVLRSERLIGLSKEEAFRLHSELNKADAMGIPSKTEVTAAELALVIQTHCEISMSWPPGFEVTVRECPADGWLTKCYSPDPVRDAHVAAKVRSVAETMKRLFQLKSR
jgi:hypothetical protein